jgi:hypothetical protein
MVPPLNGFTWNVNVPIAKSCHIHPRMKFLEQNFEAELRVLFYLVVMSYKRKNMNPVDQVYVKVCQIVLSLSKNSPNHPQTILVAHCLLCEAAIIYWRVAVTPSMHQMGCFPSIRLKLKKITQNMTNNFLVV